MRRNRSHTTCIQLDTKSQQIQSELLDTKKELQILKHSYTFVQKQRDILKEGNINLVSQFVFNKSSQDLGKLTSLLKQKQICIYDLKQKLRELQQFLQNGNSQQDLNQKKSQSSSFKKFLSPGVKQPIQQNKQFDNLIKQIKKKVIEVQQNCQVQKTKNSQLQEQNFNLGQQIQILKKEIKSCRNQIKSGMQADRLDKLDKQAVKIKEDLKSKQLQIAIKNKELAQNRKSVEQIKKNQQQLVSKNKQLQQNVSKLQEELATIKSKNSIIFDPKQFTSMPPLPIFSDNQKLSGSQYGAEQIRKSFLNDSGYFTERQDSVINNDAQKLEKKIAKLQKTNVALEKDYKQAQQKIKTLNREYSKLKLDYMKVSEQYKRKDQQCERKLQILNAKIQSFAKKQKQQQGQVIFLKKQKQSQKSVLKQIISQSEKKQVQNDRKYQKLKVQNNQLQQEINKLKHLQQKSSILSNEIQFQRNKNKILQKDLQTKASQFQKCQTLYEGIISQYKQLYGENLDRKKNESDQKVKSNKNKNQPQLNFSDETLLKTFQQQMKQFEQNIKYENQRCNILENSNKQLRKQLLKMIDQEEKLRKDLINQKIKNRTNSLSSRNSRSFSSKRLVQQIVTEKSNQINNPNTSAVSLNKSNSSRKIFKQNSKLNTERSSDSFLIQKTKSSEDINRSQVIDSRTIQNKYLDTNKTQISYLKAMRQKRFNAGNQDANKQDRIKQASIPSPQIGKSNNDQKLITPPINQRNYSNNSRNYKIETNQMTDDNHEFTLEISSSKSNLSKRDKFNEFNLVQNPTNDIDKQLKPIKQPQSATKKISLTKVKQEELKKNNLFVSKNQSTKSTFEVKFQRKKSK